MLFKDAYDKIKKVIKMINYKLIVSDFDGTLADKNCEVPEENLNAIKKYINAGGIFALSTGRLPSAILPQVCEMGLKGLICCGQGTVCLDIESGAILFEERLSLEATLTACRKLEEMGVHILAFDLFEFYSNRDDEVLKFYESLSKAKGIPVTDRKLSEILEEKQIRAYKLMALVEAKDNEKVISELKSANLPDCDITKSMDVLVEIVNPTKSKGTAIKFLAEYYNVPIEKTIGIGDNFNDLPMIEAAGLGVAVGNAESTLKQRAGYVCERTNEECAVKEVIEKFGLK